MRQWMRMRIMKLLAGIVVLSFMLGTGGLASGSEKTKADLVVYGKIFTSDNNKVAKAFAVKDGKYIYVGDKKGAAALVEAGRTDVVDYTDKGLVMPGCGNGHAHYPIAYAMTEIGAQVGDSDDANKFLTEILPAAVKKAKAANLKAVFGLGWNLDTFKDNMPTRQQIDAVCKDLPVFFIDEEGHKSLVNTLSLVHAGIMKEDGTVLKKENDIRGGEIVMGSDGTPTGYLKEQAATYVRAFLDGDNLFTADRARTTLRKVQDTLLSEGYTMYLDGYSSYFRNNNLYKAASEMDKAGTMHFVLGTAYEIESWMDVDAELAKAVEVQKYASKHVKTNWLKFYMDGTVESGTGFINPSYTDGHQGLVNWTEDEFTRITRKANENGLTMHVHALGNQAVHRTINAFVNGGKDEMRNTLVHLRNVNPPDYERMARHNIQVTAGLLWHHTADASLPDLLRSLPAGMGDKGYPMKSYFDYGINMSSHSDFPALAASPDDPFGIMEITVTGAYYPEKSKPWWPEELLTREQALTALTINCAKQMFLEKERGSITKGKYADFLLVDKDVLTCPVTEIHKARPEATYFEGKKVFANPAAAPVDYADKNNWMKQPKITKDVDTIYIYPTEYADDSAGAPVFAAINEKAMREPAQETYLLQGTAYEDATNVFVPYYRQVNMAAASEMTPEALRAAFNSVPKQDVFAALDYYFANLNGGRPFILAGHSQGSAMQSLVLAEYMKAHPEYQQRMIAAYVIGFSITKEYLQANPHLHFAERADDTGVIVSWNTEGPANAGKKNLVVLPGAISINPLNWKRDETYAPAAENLGGYIYNEAAGKIEQVPKAADARLDLKRGVVITKTNAMKPIYEMFGITVFGPASYHNGDYALYYYNIKDNVARRIAAYKSHAEQRRG